MTRRGYFIRLAISIAIDVINVILRFPGIGEADDAVSAVALTVLWGPIGLLSLWELADLTEQIDGLVPTATLIALYVGWKKGFIGKRRHAPTTSSIPSP